MMLMHLDQPDTTSHVLIALAFKATMTTNESFTITLHSLVKEIVKTHRNNERQGQ